ncbi:hypothetical protein ONJ23_25715, partial [Salmonella enterica subsp. enterica serovar Virginia]|nr:hypothetical protein [Salmonella enterica subsp. enterica serovar Virginia]
DEQNLELVLRDSLLEPTTTVVEMVAELHRVYSAKNKAYGLFNCLQGEKINRCAPGGEAVMLKIAELLNVEPQPCDGEEQQAAPVR